MSMYIESKDEKIDPAERVNLNILRYNKFSNSHHIRKASVVRGVNDYVVDEFIARQILLSGLRLVVSIALSRNEDYRTYSYMQEDHIDPTQCEHLDYRYTKDYVTITSDCGDYVTIRWGKIYENSKQQ